MPRAPVEGWRHATICIEANPLLESVGVVGQDPQPARKDRHRDVQETQKSLRKVAGSIEQRTARTQDQQHDAYGRISDPPDPVLLDDLPEHPRDR